MITTYMKIRNDIRSKLEIIDDDPLASIFFKNVFIVFTVLLGLSLYGLAILFCFIELPVVGNIFAITGTAIFYGFNSSVYLDEVFYALGVTAFIYNFIMLIVRVANFSCEPFTFVTLSFFIFVGIIMMMTGNSVEHKELN